MRVTVVGGACVPGADAQAYSPEPQRKEHTLPDDHEAVKAIDLQTLDESCDVCEKIRQSRQIPQCMCSTFLQGMVERGCVHCDVVLYDYRRCEFQDIPFHDGALDFTRDQADL